MLIIGLGNPGKEYEKTRHNVGWMLLDKFAARAGLKFSLEKKHRSEVARGNYRGRTVTLAKPLTYMNLSGQAVVSLANYYKYLPGEILVVYDDRDFDVGSFKIKHNGSSAGHNGIKSLIGSLGTENFPRLRIGIGPKPKEMAMSNFVLQNFSKQEMEIIDPVLDKGIEALDMILADGIEKAMTYFNRKDV